MFIATFISAHILCYRKCTVSLSLSQIGFNNIEFNGTEESTMGRVETSANHFYD
jgi:hypothetical protein